LTILTLSPIAPEISSSAGAIMRQGPHHFRPEIDHDRARRLEYLSFEIGV